MDLAPYRILNEQDLITPALAIYPGIVASNIDAMIRVCGGDPNRWRPHVKTSKLGFVMSMLAARGVVNVKCSTTLELAVACEAGMRDVVVAYAMVGANARRVQAIAAAHPDVRISILVENAEQAASWAGTPIGLFIDVNSGMNRTGISDQWIEEVAAIARAAGGQFRGLHFYDGHMNSADLTEREQAAHAGYRRLLELISAVGQVPEVITSGTPAFPAGLSFEPFRNASFVHRVSPGTVVYNDFVSLGQLPAEYGFRPAAVIVATVVSHPLPDVVTCDAGHKSVSADAGVPTCQVIGRPDLTPLKPSEEHLPVQIAPGAPVPVIGDKLYLLPRHVCPSVNNFDDALLIENGQICRVERVSARGHESPLAFVSAV